MIKPAEKECNCAANILNKNFNFVFTYTSGSPRDPFSQILRQFCAHFLELFSHVLRRAKTRYFMVMTTK